jgi:hypothetical protein
MLVQMYEDGPLETLEMPVRDAQTFVDLVKAHGYEDAEGQQYDFVSARVEYPKKLVIYLSKDSE